MMKFDLLVKKAIEELENNDDLFVSMIEELDSWNGFADGFRCYDMDELDEFYCDAPATKLLNDLTPDFNINDSYFYFTIWGLESTDDKVQLYKDNTSEGELFDNIFAEFDNLDFWGFDEFKELMSEIMEANKED